MNIITVNFVVQSALFNFKSLQHRITKICHRHYHHCHYFCT